MKLLAPFVLVVLAAQPAFAGEAEGTGWTIKLPAGYVKQIDSESCSGGG